MSDYERHGNNTENRQAQPKCCWCFDSSLTRFLALILITVIGFIVSAVFFLPEALHNLIVSKLHLDHNQIDTLYYVNIIPSLLWCILNGFIMDRWLGLKMGSIVFAMIAFFGQIVTTASGFSESYWMMLLGRFINGFGAVVVVISLYCFCVQWFQLYELNFSFGLLHSISSLGYFFTLAVSETFDSYAEEVVSKSKILGISMSLFLAFYLIQLLLLALLIYKTYFQQTSYFSSENRSTERIFKFPLMFWIVSILSALIVGSFSAFVLNFKRIFKDKYALSNDEVTEFKGFLFLLGGLTAALPGLLADVIGRNIIFNIIGIISGLVSHYFFTFTNITPYVPIVLLALHFSISSSCLLPLISYIVNSYQLTVAYGISTSITYLTSLLSNVLIVYLLDNYDNLAVGIYFTILLFVALLISLIIYTLDHNTNGNLNMSVYRRRILMQIPLL